RGKDRCCSPISISTEPTAVRIHRCGYVSQCRAHTCLKRATLIAEKVDRAGRHVRQIELCALHCETVIERERARGLEICDRRNEQRPCRSRSAPSPRSC